MPDTSSTRAPSVGDTTAASRDIRQRAKTIQTTVKTDLTEIKRWPDLNEPDHASVGNAAYDLRGLWMEVGKTCAGLGVTGVLSAACISEVTKTLNDLEEKIRIKTDVIKREIEEYNSQTQTSTAKTLEARSVSEENVDE